MVALAPTPRADSADHFVVVPAATRFGGVPAIGWTRVAMVLRSLQEESHAIVLVELVGAGQIVIDWARRSYWWTSQPEAFPMSPRIARVRVARGNGSEVPFVQEQPGKLDALLWYVGRAAFASEQAWWLSEGDSYRVLAWPNFTGVAHEPDDVRMVAMLASTALTTTQLAAVAGVEHEKAERLVNALSLMDLLLAVPAVEAPPVAAEPAPVKREGLFERLRSRLGL